MIKKVMAFQLLIDITVLLLFCPIVFAGPNLADSPESTDTAKTAETLQITESWIVDWPKEDKWTSDYVHTSANSRMEIFYPAGQKAESWKEMMTVEALYVKKKNIAGIARQIYLGTVRGSPNATWDILKKGMNEQERPFITFEIICPDFLSGEPPQVQLWKLIIGHTGLFTLQYSYHGADLPPARREQLLDVFDRAVVEAEKK